MAAPSPTSRYEEVLARAVAAMPTDANERCTTYDRARTALVERLRAIDPPIPEAAIEAEQAALEAAIQRVEMRFADSADDTGAPPPTTPIVLHDRRRGTLMAVVGGAAVILALLIGSFAYQHGRDIGRSALRGLRQATVTRNDTGPAQNSDKHASATMPYIFMRQLVPYRSTNPPGTLVIDKEQRYLYVILKNVPAVRYGIALGDNCVETAGRYTVSRKIGPDGSQSLQVVPANAASGNRALYLDSDIHLIHGTDSSSSIGQSIGNGCFQLIQTDLAELYGRVPVGTRVVVN